MKEATGELNMTVVTVVAIGAILALLTAFVVPALRNNIRQRTYCASATCGTCTEEGGKRTCEGCTYIDEKGETHDDLKCVYDTESTTE